MYVLLYVSLNVTTRLSLDRFSWNFIFRYFSKICQEYSCFIKIYREIQVLYKRTNVNILLYLAQLFLEWEIFQTNVVQKIKIRILCSITFFFFRKSCYLWNNVKKNIVEPDRPRTTMWRMRIAYCIPKATDIHSVCVILIAFPMQQWLHGHTTMLCYTYISCLVSLSVSHACVKRLQPHCPHCLDI